jgi:hypothetical protein
MPKETGAKESGPTGAGSKSKPAKVSSAKGSGAIPEQPELFAADSSPPAKAAKAAAPAKAPAEPPQAAAPPKSALAESAVAAPVAQAPAADPVVVTELVNGVDGVWKKLSNGKRVDLTTKEWRQELSRLFTRAPAP